MLQVYTCFCGSCNPSGCCTHPCWDVQHATLFVGALPALAGRLMSAQGKPRTKAQQQPASSMNVLHHTHHKRCPPPNAVINCRPAGIYHDTPCGVRRQRTASSSPEAPHPSCQRNSYGVPMREAGVCTPTLAALAGTWGYTNAHTPCKSPHEHALCVQAT